MIDAYEIDEAVEWIMESAEDDELNIRQALKNKSYDYVDALLLYRRGVPEVPEDTYEKLMYTEIERSLRNEATRVCLTELWGILSKEEVEGFFRAVLDSHGRVVVRIGEKGMNYMPYQQTQEDQ